jgi:ribonuclease HII
LVNFTIEKNLIKKGYNVIAGIDEVGRGALFGPVVASAVVWPPSFFEENISEGLVGINDSKLLSPKKRKQFTRAIIKEAASIGIGLSSSVEIDRINIYRASLKAMKRAVHNLPTSPDILLIDGFSLKGVEYPQMSIRQGDRKSVSIAAASIVAKVIRDEMIELLDKIFGGYFLHKNKGYGTKEHYRALTEKGPTLLHRYSFNLG